MDGFSVCPGELEDVAGVLREVADEFAGQSTLRYRMDPSQGGDPVLAHALEEFQRESRTSAHRLRTGLTEIAGRLTEAHRWYEDCETRAQEAMTALLRSGAGPDEP